MNELLAGASCLTGIDGEFGTPAMRRKLVKVFRTVTWYHYQRQYLNAHSAYELGKLVTPGSYRCAPDNVNRTHDNIWPKYRRGQHSPSRGRLIAAERMSPGSMACFDHVLWDVLVQPPRGSKALEAFVGRLSPDAQRIRQRWRDRGVWNGSPHAQFQKMLLLLNWLDSLAAILLELYGSLLCHDGLAAHNWARALCQSVLVHHEQAIQHGIARPLMEFLNRAVLPQAVYENLSYMYPAELFLDAARQIDRHVPQAPTFHNSHAQNMRDGWRHIVQAMRGGWGWDLFFVVNPVRVTTAPDKLAVEVASHDQFLFNWGRHMLLSGTRDQSIPKLVSRDQ